MSIPGLKRFNVASTLSYGISRRLDRVSAKGVFAMEPASMRMNQPREEIETKSQPVLLSLLFAGMKDFASTRRHSDDMGLVK